MRSKERARIRQVQMKNGFYIEVCNNGMKKGVKIRRETRKDMEDAAGLYAQYKDVIILGEYKNGVPLIKIPVS